jgi:hypothetical protein
VMPKAPDLTNLTASEWSDAVTDAVAAALNSFVIVVAAPIFGYRTRRVWA